MSWGMLLDLPIAWLVIVVLYWLGVVVVLISEDRDATSTVAWIVVLVALPGVGLVFYYFAGRDWHNRTKGSKWYTALQSVRLPFMKDIWGVSLQHVEQFREANNKLIIQQLMYSIWNQTKVPPLAARDIEIWTAGADYFPELIRDLQSASESICMQYFIWEDDALADRIIDTLIERVSQGVEVRVLNDFVGSITYSKRGLMRLKRAGGKVEHDITAFNKLNYRNHRKITVIDGTIAHTGGFNIGQEYVDGGRHYDSWRDTGVRLAGPAVLTLQDLFCQRWFEVTGESLYLARYFPQSRLGEGNILSHTVAHGVEDLWKAAASSYDIAISTAAEYVWIQSPYYVPTDAVENALINAAFSGTDVRVMITGVPDKKIAWYAAFSYFRKLLYAGAKVYLYEPGFFHAKSLVADNAVCAIGTMNLDVRSLELHKEMMIWLYSDELAARCKTIFQDDLQKCRELTLQDLDEMTVVERFRNSACRLASKLL